MMCKVFLIVVILAGAISAAGQAVAGGAKAGIGRVYDAAGKSAAARGVQQKMNGGLLRMAVAKSKTPRAKATPARTPAITVAAKRPTATPATVIEPDLQPSYTDFRPATGTDFVERFASALSTNPNEKELVRQLVTVTRTEFEKEVAKRGRANNLAAALTFFIASTVTVYNDDPEPSDQAIDQLWDGLNDTLNGLPEMSKMTDAEKQEMYEMLVACGGLVLAGHMISKQGGDANSAAAFRKLAGELIKTIMQTDPDKLKFNSGGLNVAG